MLSQKHATPHRGGFKKRRISILRTSVGTLGWIHKENTLDSSKFSAVGKAKTVSTGVFYSTTMGKRGKMSSSPE